MEKHFSDKVLRAFDGEFIVNKEVFGTHFSGARLRIDAVLKPKKTSLWKNPNVALGIEFKLKEKLNGTKDSTAWMKQCVDYANTKWDNHGYLYVFSCPSIFDDLDHCSIGVPSLWNRFLSNLGVGRVAYNDFHGWTFYLQDTHRIWSERGGVASGKHWSLIRKFGRDSFVVK